MELAFLSTSNRCLPVMTMPNSDVPSNATYHSTTTSMDRFRHRLPVEVIERIIKWIGWLGEDPFGG